MKIFNSALIVSLRWQLVSLQTTTIFYLLEMDNTHQLVATHVFGRMRIPYGCNEIHMHVFLMF